ncbi:hypothetical protein [Nonomuraea sp. NPDC049625]|uniref:hypothetical protein n=1 Tax=Nonomuraea sp. NPDC049625 TaxID=3155775 RepID=UPI003422C284
MTWQGSSYRQISFGITRRAKSELAPGDYAQLRREALVVQSAKLGREVLVVQSVELGREVLVVQSVELGREVLVVQSVELGRMYAAGEVGEDTYPHLQRRPDHQTCATPTAGQIMRLQVPRHKA